PREEHLQVALLRADGAAASAEPELEDPGALQEELALLGKEDRKPCEIDDRVVDFGLREIGVRGELRRQAWRDAEPNRLEADVARAADGGRSDRARVAKAAEDVWLDAQLQPGLEIADAGEMSGLRDLEKREVAAPAGPVRALVLPSDVALEVHAERVEIAARAQRRQRDLDLGGPAVGGHPRLRPPALVPLGVDVVALVGDERVVLGAERIDREVKRVAMIVEGVEEDLDVVVAGERV